MTWLYYGLAGWLALNIFILGLRSYLVWRNQPPPKPKRTCEVIRLYS